MAVPATAMATSKTYVPRIFVAAVLTTIAVAVTAAGCQSSPAAAAHPGQSGRSGADSPGTKVRRIHTLSAQRAPASWHLLTLPDRGAVLAVPPSMHRVPGDRGSVSAAKLGHSGAYLLYLNVTPKQGDETLNGWPEFRIDHVAEEEHTTPHLIAASHGVRFLGGTGSCVLDTYVTKVKANHYTEIACYVQGKTSSSVIVGAAPTADWANASGPLMRAVAAFRVR
jgi:hypothetical protein